jgi:hypothetical protein
VKSIRHQKEHKHDGTNLLLRWSAYSNGNGMAYNMKGIRAMQTPLHKVIGHVHSCPLDPLHFWTEAHLEVLRLLQKLVPATGWEVRPFIFTLAPIVVGYSHLRTLEPLLLVQLLSTIRIFAPT